MITQTFKSILVLAVAITTLSIFQSCSDDNIPPVESIATLELEGQWTISSVNFLDETANWNEEIAYTSESGLGWAPALYTQIKGVNFQMTKTQNENGTELGNALSFIVTEAFPFDTEEAHWYWNYKDEQQNFELKQIDAALPAYNFSFGNITDIVMHDEGDKIVFKTMIASRKSGEDLTQTIQVPVEFVIYRGVPTATAQVLLNGITFEMPELELTETENQALLLAELKENMGSFNGAYSWTALVPAEFQWMTTIEGFDMEKVAYEITHDLNSRDETDVPFVCIDKNNTFHFWSTSFGSMSVSYKNYQIEKEGSIYTIWGEHEDGEVYKLQPTDEEVSLRSKIIFNAETRETLALRETVSILEGTTYVYLDTVTKWVQNPEIVYHSFSAEYFSEHPLLNLEL